jgi:hypothetical protein
VTLGFLAAALAAPPAAPAAGPEEPVINGVNAAKLGMPPSQLKKFYPDAYEVPQPTPKPGEKVPPFTMPLYKIAGQTVGPLTDCALDCQFFNDYLYEIYVQCPQPRSEIEAYLEKEYGKPGIDEGPIKQWLFDTRNISYTAASGQFLIEDKVFGQKVRLAMLSFTTKGVPGAAAPQQPKPEENPAN